jgi:hypothetical protein
MVLAAAAQAATPSVTECVAASGAGQEHQKKGFLFSALQELEICTDPACPTVVRVDCAKWRDEVLAAMPSINIVVRLDGVDQPRALVLLDGAPWLDQLLGRPRDLEPGEHHVTVELGGTRQDQRLVIVQGEKNRVVVFSFTGGAAPPPTPPPAAHAEGHFPLWPVVFSALAVAGGTTFTVLGLTGKARLASLVGSPCAETKTCDPAQAASISRQFLAADISLGVGVACAIAAGGFWWWWAKSDLPAPSVTVIPAGASLSVVGTW